MTPALALRISYAGELGWEIYARTEYGLALWDTLWQAGQQHGCIAAGGGAFDSLRLEKGYRLWGADIDMDHDPYSAGLGWTVRLQKGEFLGWAALRQAKAGPLASKLCCLTFDGADSCALGKEPVLANGKAIGFVTSANAGHSVQRNIAYAYLPLQYAQVGSALQVEYFGVRHPVTVTAEPLFDPDNLKLLA
jgi:glycine cleavage system aminomethyltransferase T